MCVCVCVSEKKLAGMANSIDLDQTDLQEHSNHGLHCLHSYFVKKKKKKKKKPVQNFRTFIAANEPIMKAPITLQMHQP